MSNRRAFGLILVVLWWAGSSEADDDQQPHQMLPLAVGNSWVYEHLPGQEVDRDVTISITHTEDIDGHTYHVFSDMPYEDPPVPYFFIAGKKVRWENDRLLFRQQGEDVAFFRFDRSVFENPERYEWWEPRVDFEYAFEYVFPKIEIDTLTDTVAVAFPNWKSYDAFLQGIPRIGGCLQVNNRLVFEFSLFNYDSDPFSTPRLAEFIEDFGMSFSATETNLIEAQYAVINGEKFDFWIDPTGKVLATREESPCLLRTVVEKSPWGVLKQAFTHPSKSGDIE